MKKLTITYYNRNRDNTWNFKQSFHKEYYFHNKSKEDIISFIETLQSYEIVYIHTWHIEEA